MLGSKSRMGEYMSEKARYWSGVLYPENMIDDWESDIAKILQVPYCYCIHNKDCTTKKEVRKEHVHVIIAFGNTTTLKTALSVLNSLSAVGCVCCSTVEPVRSIRFMYDYLIHDTEDCKKKSKHLYDKSERISGNGFDIGSYEQVGVVQKLEMSKELADVLCEKGFEDYMTFYMYVMSNYGMEYFEIIKSSSGFYERLCKGNYLLHHNSL